MDIIGSDCTRLILRYAQEIEDFELYQKRLRLVLSHMKIRMRLKTLIQESVFYGDCENIEEIELLFWRLKFISRLSI